jgi:hypothetical protein
MKAMGAIRQFMGTQGTNPNMTYTTPGAREMKAFLDICTPEEKRQFALDACEIMGVELDE